MPGKDASQESIMISDVSSFDWASDTRNPYNWSSVCLPSNRSEIRKDIDGTAGEKSRCISHHHVGGSEQQHGKLVDW